MSLLTPAAIPRVFSATERPLSLDEARVLATLMEKARTVPDSYPMTLNTLLAGCNQKTSREPLMNLSEAEAQQALDTLLADNLVRASSGSRSLRYEHNFQRSVGVPEQSAVLLGLLLLRGAQTAAELRLNAERWYRFADVSSVEGFLEELQERAPIKGGPLTLKLALAPGAREARWMHLLCGPVNPLHGHSSAPSSPNSKLMESRIALLEDEVAQLRSTVLRLCSELGVEPSPPTLSQPGQT